MLFISRILERNVPCGKKNCIIVHFNEAPSYLEIRSTEIWFHMTSENNKSSLFKFTEINKLYGSRGRKLYASVSHKHESGWFATKLQTDVIARRTRAGSRFVQLRAVMECRNCRFSREKEEQPFIVLSVANKIQKRKKRDNPEVCTPSSSCCRSSFKVDFKNIGWQNWILSPKTYDAYYCQGNCDNDHSSQPRQFRHTGIVKAAIKKSIRDDIKLCCTPKKYSSLSMLYMLNSSIIKKEVNNMVIDECWCI